MPIRKAVRPVKPLRAGHPGSSYAAIFWYSPKLGVGKDTRPCPPVVSLLRGEKQKEILKEKKFEVKIVHSCIRGNTYSEGGFPI